jgi:hypothetical protein
MDSTPALASPYPELILRTGRHQGTRRALKAPITFIGSEKGCDIRLTVNGVQPFHCVIAVGPDGPILRSWNQSTVTVNGLAVHLQQIQDGDLLGIGPFEFEIRASASTLPSPSNPGPNEFNPNERLDEIRDLQRQLSEGRAEFRRDRKEKERRIAEQLHDLAAARESVEKRENDTRRECSRLEKLRKRFIRRWKTHWSTERSRLEKEAECFQREHAVLESQRAEFSEREQHSSVQMEVERRRIDDGWQKLRAAEQSAKNEQADSQAKLDAQRRVAADAHRQIQTERAVLQRERLHAEQHVSKLRIEAAGLESRIVNLRAVLLQAQTDRGPQPVLADVFDKLPTCSAENVPAVEERSAELERLIAEVSDQRRLLVDQTDRLAEARETWRDEEKRLVREIEQLGERLRSWENRLIKREKRSVEEENALEGERTNLEQMRDRLDAWQARLLSREGELREKTLRVEADLHQRCRQIERREIEMAELCRRWGERRRAEVLALRTEHRRCAKLRVLWQRRQNHIDQRERALAEQQRDVAAQSLVVESARQRLVAAGSDPRVAARKIERLQRRIDRANGKQNDKLEARWQALRAEKTALAELFDRTSKCIVKSAALERELADRLAEAESRERRLTDREIALAESATVWKIHRESYQRECGELRDEIDRLAGLLIEAGPSETVPLAQAA